MNESNVKEIADLRRAVRVAEALYRTGYYLASDGGIVLAERLAQARTRLREAEEEAAKPRPAYAVVACKGT